jgi:hypothetical protein
MSATVVELARVSAAAKAAALATEQADEANAKLHSAVESARAAGATWAAIGEVLGITRQAAFKRFSKNIQITK